MSDVGKSTSLPASADRRIAHERQLLEEARAEFEQGLYANGDEVGAWLDAIDKHSTMR